MKKWPENIKISHIGWAKQKLNLGDLKGNHFKLGLRFCDLTEEELTSSNYI
jgi:tRNA(Glu) U13 pseudouridine synthase TruD